MKAIAIRAFDLSASIAGMSEEDRIVALVQEAAKAGLLPADETKVPPAQHRAVSRSLAEYAPVVGLFRAKDGSYVICRER